MKYNGSSSSKKIYPKKSRDSAAVAAVEDTDLTCDQPQQQRYNFSEARSTPIIYSTPSDVSSSSSSLSEQIVKRYRPSEYDTRSLCSVQSGAVQPQQQQHESSDNSSTRNQVFYFSTPLPPQRHQPYQYHAATPATTNSSTLHHEPFHGIKKLKNKFGNSSSAASVKSAFSTGVKSWRQKRISLLQKKRQRLPDQSTHAFCDVCEKSITTRIRYRNGAMVWLTSFILLLCTVILFWVPFYVKYFKGNKSVKRGVIKTKIFNVGPYNRCSTLLSRLWKTYWSYLSFVTR